MKTLDLFWMYQHNWALIAHGEGAASVVVPGKSLPEELHEFMCYCGKGLVVCGDSTQALELLEEMKDSDNWTFDESGRPFYYSWSHECGSVSVTRIDVIKHRIELT